VELQVVDAYKDMLADPICWQDQDKRDRFAKVGFHHAEDNHSVRQEFSRRLARMNFRARSHRL
jgi:hypothetical protein